MQSNNDEAHDSSVSPDALSVYFHHSDQVEFVNLSQGVHTGYTALQCQCAPAAQ